jgi:hypothetical protein
MQFLTTNPSNFCAPYSEPDLSKQRHVNRHNPLGHSFQSSSEILWFRKRGKMVSAKNASTLIKT